jgi:hypothetical protein
VAVDTAPAGVSGAIGDIVIRATSGTSSADHSMTERTPYSLVAGTISTTCDPTYAYSTSLVYGIRDQFAAPLPLVALPLNEQWTSGVVNDWAQNNWSRGSEGSTTVSTSAFADVIQGERKNRKPTAICDANNTQPVQHWSGAWQIGSLTIGAGKRVQTNVWQKNLGRALHTSIVTPP